MGGSSAVPAACNVVSHFARPWLRCFRVVAFAALAIPASSSVFSGAGPGAPRADASAGTPHRLLWPAPATASAISPRVEDIVNDLLAHMTLEEKVGQMIQADIAYVTPQELREYKLGAVLAGGGSAPGGNVRAAPAAHPDSVRHRCRPRRCEDPRRDDLPPQHRARRGA